MRKVRSKLERLGLMSITVPPETAKVLDTRTAPFFKLHIDTISIHAMPHHIEQYGRDCYLQGLVDGAGLGAKNPSIVLGNTITEQG